MKDYQVYDDTKAWEPLTGWLEGTVTPPRHANLEITPEILAEIV